MEREISLSLPRMADLRRRAMTQNKVPVQPKRTTVRRSGAGDVSGSSVAADCFRSITPWRKRVGNNQVLGYSANFPDARAGVKKKGEGTKMRGRTSANCRNWRNCENRVKAAGVKT